MSAPRVVVDVQHLYRTDHPNDQGAVFRLYVGGEQITEGHLASIYAQSIVNRLIAAGCEVLTNHEVGQVLVGTYRERNLAANAWKADAYLACHVNAGGGSYALARSYGPRGLILGRWIGAELVRSIPEIRTFQVRKLRRWLGPLERGGVCVRAVQAPAVILEPFFGDYRPMRALYSIARLAQVGDAIAKATLDWWASLEPGLPPPV